MILYTDASTPFGRKCLLAALERRIPIKEEFVDLANPGPFAEINPLVQIPALKAADGEVYFDSDVILQYLDACHHGAPLIPADGRFARMTRIHLANGVIEATLYRRMETVRPASEQSPGFIKHLESRISRGLARLEQLCHEPHDSPLDAEDITKLCALDYVDFRYPHGWRNNHPKLATWLARVSERGTAQVSKPGRSDPVAAPL
jgi:glutathione S-transferase